jgi:hypothetical protein
MPLVRADKLILYWTLLIAVFTTYAENHVALLASTERVENGAYEYELWVFPGNFASSVLCKLDDFADFQMHFAENLKFMEFIYS